MHASFCRSTHLHPIVRRHFLCRCLMQQVYAVFLAAKNDPTACDLDVILVHESYSPPDRHFAKPGYPVNVLRNIARLQVQARTKPLPECMQHLGSSGPKGQLLPSVSVREKCLNSVHALPLAFHHITPALIINLHKRLTSSNYIFCARTVSPESLMAHCVPRTCTFTCLHVTSLERAVGSRSKKS